jgi:hypothetical protein
LAAARIHVSTVIALAISGIIVASAGGWLTGRWPWSVAAGALGQVAFAAGVALARGKGERAPQPATGASVASASVAAGNDAYVAGRDLHNTNITKVARRPATLAPVAILAGSLILVVAGTAYWGTQPGGRFRAAPSVRATAPGKDSPRSPAAGHSPPHAALPAGAPASGTPQDTWNTVATFHEEDPGGDSVTQSISFAAPRPLSELPAVAAAYEETGSQCAAAAPIPPARDLAIPFQIMSTLNSRVQVQASIELGSADFLTDAGADNGLIAESPDGTDVLGAYQEGISCDVDEGFNNGTAPVLALPGDPVTFDGWLIFQDVVSASYPDGDTAALGQTFAYLDVGLGGTAMSDVQATGPGVCDPPASALSQSADPPLLHIGGPVTSPEGCTGSFSN